MRDLTFKMSATASFAFDSAEDVVGESASRYKSRINEWDSFVRETFGRLYRPQDTERALTSPEPWASKATDALTTSAEWREACLASRSHRLVAAETAARLSDGIGKVLGLDKLPDSDASSDPASLDRAIRRGVEMRDEAQERLRQAMEAGDEEATQDAQYDVDGFTKAINEASKAADIARARRRVIAEAIEKNATGIGWVVASAATEASKTAEAIAMLREAGVGTGGDGESGDIDGDLVKLVRESSDVRKVLEQVGRDRKAESRRAGATTGGRLDVVGVDAGSDVFSLVTSEMMALSMGGVARMNVLARAMQGAALTIQRRGDDTTNGGDFVLLIDRSGSMTGARQRAARAFGMGAILRALSERRRVVLVCFDDGPAARVVIERDGKGMTDAAKALLLSAGGGTDAVGAMRAAVDALSSSERGKVDTLIVTDGEWQDPTKEQLRSLRRGGGTFKAVLIGGASSKPWLDGAWEMDNAGNVREVRQ